MIYKEVYECQLDKGCVVMASIICQLDWAKRCSDIFLNVISGSVLVYHHAGEVHSMQNEDIWKSERRCYTTDGVAREMASWHWE